MRIGRPLAQAFLYLRSLAKVITAWAQVHCELLLGIEYSPLNCADGDGFGGGDLVILPLLYKSQRHCFLLLGIEKLHPVCKFRGGSEWIVVLRGREQLTHVAHVYGWHLARALSEVPVRGVACDLEQPG